MLLNFLYLHTNIVLLRLSYLAQKIFSQENQIIQRTKFRKYDLSWKFVFFFMMSLEIMINIKWKEIKTLLKYDQNTKLNLT